MSKVRTVQSSEAKANLTELLDEVERGETIVITRGGKTIARLVSPETEERERRMRAVEELQAWRRSLPRAGITIEDILAAKEEGRK